MIGDVIYEVFGVKAGRDKDSYFHAYNTRTEAEAQVQKLKEREWGAEKNYTAYHDDFEIREVTVNTDFVVPSKPTPRERYTVRTSAIKNKPGTWDSTKVEILSDGNKVAEFVRNYAMLGAFEPFRQGGRDYALVSPHYTATSVLDLQTGEMIASEEPAGHGFCPVGFYVPDWWDVHDDSILPGSKYWDKDDEWPVGDFGFVWGCVWGDDTSWKLQYLDLSDITKGEIRRDDRFGYVEVATQKDPRDFIRVWSDVRRITVATEVVFDLESGKSTRKSLDFHGGW